MRHLLTPLLHVDLLLVRPAVLLPPRDPRPPHPDLRKPHKLTAEAPDRLATYRIEIEIINTLKRIFYFTKRIARLAVPEPERAAITDD